MNDKLEEQNIIMKLHQGNKSERESASIVHKPPSTIPSP